MKITNNIDENISQLREYFNIGVSFDVIGKEIQLKNRRGFFVMIDGFTKDEIMFYITTNLQDLFVTDFEVQKLIEKHLAYMEVEESTDMNQIEEMVLSGAIALFIDGFDSAIIIDAREYPVRSPQEPDLEKVTRGPRDGFVETVIFNTALIRRRVRDRNLTFELTSVGSRSKTNVVLSYISDLVDQEYVQEIRDKISSIKIESLTMAEKSLSELLIDRSIFNPLPQVRYTERPDAAAAHLMEGHLLIIVDTTPSVIILPTTIFHFTQHAEDYYQSPAVGTYIRWLRFGIMTLSFLLVPLWLLATEYVRYLPEFMQFLTPEKTGEVPLLLQLIILELGIDILRLSSIHTPNSLTTSLGIISGLVLGDLAVQVGWFIPETVLYMAVVAIGTFATPSIEFAMAIRIFRLYLLILTGLFNIIGFIVGIFLVCLCIFKTKNSSKKSYLWPLIPFNATALKHLLFRTPIPNQVGNKRHKK